MAKFTRREFLKIGAMLAASAGLSGTHGKVLAAGLEKLASRAVPVLWLQGQSCSGCSVSLLNTERPDALSLVTEIVNMIFHQTISAAQGGTVGDILDKVESLPQGSFVLAIEGSIPTKIPEACTLSGKPLADILPRIARKAKYIIGVGTCATYGGIPAAEGNLTGALSVQEFLNEAGVTTKNVLVNCPLCPVHADSVVGTIAYLAAEGYPKVHPELLTPEMYYSRSTHDNCPRYHYYAKHMFAKHFGDTEGCLFKLGCLGPLSFTECPSRQWNGGVNWCIRAGAPCIGCSHHQFTRSRDFPFYRKGEKVHKVAYSEDTRKGDWA